ncbi:MAG: ABC transporter substrate-binding protein [Pseudomonadota bacterium]
MITALTGIACNSIVGLDDFSIQEVSKDPNVVGECTTNQECVDRATARAGRGEEVPAVCVKPEGRCVELLTEDCGIVTGDYKNDNSIVLGSLFSITGAQSATNIPRQQSAMLAIEEINKVGGVPGPGGTPRELVLVSCDEGLDLMRVANHLVKDLRVPAIIGPNLSQHTVEISRLVTVPAGTVVMTPTAVASSITALDDNGLTYQLVPTDMQRAPLMISQINEIEKQLREERGREHIKLAIVFRDDALGIGTRTSLNSLVLNGKPISDPVNLNVNVRIEGYDYTAPDQREIVDRLVDFAPDIVALGGTAEAITEVMKPLEENWTAGDDVRPYYVGIDSVKVPDLITLVTGNDHLRRRIRGTGVTPTPASAPVYEAFKLSYTTRYNGASATISGMGPAYDAGYAIAFALAATRDEQPVTGHTVVKGLRALSGGGTQVEVGITKALTGFQKLVAGERITAVGTFGPLEWDNDGAVVGGSLEMWCIGIPSSTPVYQSSGLTFDLKQQREYGEYVQCKP